MWTTSFLWDMPLSVRPGGRDLVGAESVGAQTTAQEGDISIDGREIQGNGWDWGVFQLGGKLARTGAKDPTTDDRLLGLTDLCGQRCVCPQREMRPVGFTTRAR